MLITYSNLSKGDANSISCEVLGWLRDIHPTALTQKMNTQFMGIPEGVQSERTRERIAGYVENVARHHAAAMLQVGTQEVDIVNKDIVLYTNRSARYARPPALGDHRQVAIILALGDLDHLNGLPRFHSHDGDIRVTSGDILVEKMDKVQIFEVYGGGVAHVSVWKSRL